MPCSHGWAFPRTLKLKRSTTKRRSPRFASPSPSGPGLACRAPQPQSLVLREVRFALLEERPDAFDAIMRLQSHLLRAALGAQLLLQGIVEGRGMQCANLTEHRA